jgi:pimeloyl-ACP methyl ester carboxylesterase
LTPVVASTSATTPGPADATTAVAWGPCTDVDVSWQCGTLMVPEDYTKPDGTQIGIALNRLPATKPSQRVGSLVINPGGPGGSGVEAAFGLRYALPQALLDNFDLVGFDPRGIGKSMPITCAGDVNNDPQVLSACVKASGVFIANIGTNNVVQDLDRIRVALGDKKLTYLGFSYGTEIGAVYADKYPQNVRALVLDGDVDPAAGAANTTKDYSQGFYSQQDFQSTTNIFLHLCDLTKECPLGPGSSDRVNAVLKAVATLPTTNFAGAHPVTVRELRGLVESSMYSIEEWANLGIALGDAANGDASTLAALISYQEYGYPAKMNAQPSITYGLISVACADFSDRSGQVFGCQNYPPAPNPISAITTAVGAPAIVVIGTKGDPATVYANSAKMAAALGNNSVELTWEGAGHTAFTESTCIADAATAYLVSLTVPKALDCPFLPGATSDADIADRIFGHRAMMSEADRIKAILEAQGDTKPIATCISAKLADTNNHRLVVHELLGVNTPDLIKLRATIQQQCK